jgi:hypothetical protein
MLDIKQVVGIAGTKKSDHLKVQLKNLKRTRTGMCVCKKVYQPRADLLKDEKGDRIADSHSFLNRWVNRFCSVWG